MLVVAHMSSGDVGIDALPIIPKRHLPQFVGGISPLSHDYFTVVGHVAAYMVEFHITSCITQLGY